MRDWTRANPLFSMTFIVDYDFLNSWIFCSAFAFFAAATSSFETITWPTGNNDIPANLKCCMPNGIPIMVIQQRIPEKACPIISHQPANKNQIILPTIPKPPVPKSSFPVNSFLLIASFPNGKKVNFPITKQDRPHGIP